MGKRACTTIQFLCSGAWSIYILDVYGSTQTKPYEYFFAEIEKGLINQRHKTSEV